MGARKKLRADSMKEERKSVAFAKLNNYPTSPRKMRMVADMIRGKDVYAALTILKHNTKHSSMPLEKLLMSAISNWEQKNEGRNPQDEKLVVKEIRVDEGRMMKRIQPAPQGRAYRVRKRSNHVTIVVDSSN
jgi:large subunit ribosomal protein L22